MARDNYSYKKYLREKAKQKKKEEKMQRKLEKKNLKAAGGEAAAADPGIPAAEDPSATLQQLNKEE